MFRSGARLWPPASGFASGAAFLQQRERVVEALGAPVLE